MPGYVADYIKQAEEWEKVPLSDGMSHQERLDNAWEWGQDQKEQRGEAREGVYTDEELIDFAGEPFSRWTEGDFENEAYDVWGPEEGSDLPDSEEKEHTIRMRP